MTRTDAAAEQLDGLGQRQSDHVGRAAVDALDERPGRRPACRTPRPCRGAHRSPGTTRSSPRRASTNVTSVVTVHVLQAGDPPADHRRVDLVRAAGQQLAASAGRRRRRPAWRGSSPSTSTVVSAASTTTSPVGAHAELADDRHRLVVGDPCDVVDRLLAWPLATRRRRRRQHRRELEPRWPRSKLLPIRRASTDANVAASERLTLSRADASFSRPTSHDVVVVGDDESRRGRRGSARAATTLIGPLVWPRLMRSPPGDHLGRRIELGEDRVELVERGDLRQPPAHLGADRIARHVPGGVLAEVAHRERLAAVPLVVLDQQPGVRRIASTTTPSGRGAGAVPPLSTVTRSPNSHGRPRQPRPITTPSQPGRAPSSRPRRTPPRCRRCRAPGCRRPPP